jgi:hypothetical protein
LLLPVCVCASCPPDQSFQARLEFRDWSA